MQLDPWPSLRKHFPNPQTYFKVAYVACKKGVSRNIHLSHKVGSCWSRQAVSCIYTTISSSISLTNWHCSDGRPQICRRASEEKTIWCLALSLASEVLGGEWTELSLQIDSAELDLMLIYNAPLGYIISIFRCWNNRLSSANSTLCTELLVHRDQIRHVVSVTRLSKAMSSIVCVFAEEGGSDLSQRGQLMVCPIFPVLSNRTKTYASYQGSLPIKV